MKPVVRFDDRYVELQPASCNPEHEAMKLDRAKHIPNIDGVAVGTMTGASQEMPAAVASRQ